MWIICLADDSHEMSRIIFSLKQNKKSELSSAAAIGTGTLRVNIIPFLKNGTVWSEHQEYTSYGLQSLLK